MRAVFFALIALGPLLTGIKCLSFVSRQVTVRIFSYTTPSNDLDTGSGLTKSIAISLYG
jgi:hypothetical protein